ncbi:hypothetical protein C7S17_5696 [Burkholderia thailandensis]|nr:hypothetical protein [Burkholderia thailandensis]
MRPESSHWSFHLRGSHSRLSKAGRSSGVGPGGINAVHVSLRPLPVVTASGIGVPPGARFSRCRTL